MHRSANDERGNKFWRTILPVNQCSECNELSVNYLGIVLWVVLTGAAIVIIAGV